MNQNIRLDLSGVANLDPSTGTKVKLPSKKSKLPGEESLIEAAMRSYAGLGLNRGGVLSDMLDFKSKPTLRVSTVGSMALAKIKPATVFTIAAGPSGAVGALLTLGLSGGIYVANTMAGGELGFFGSFNYGVVTNASVSLVGQIMILFGAPADVLGGDSHAVAVNIGGKLVTGGGFLVFNEKIPCELIGFGVELGIGASVLPFDFTVTHSKTKLAPVFSF